MENINCIIETPKGCGAKYNFDPRLSCYVLGKMLPAGLVFPFDFGFLPGTTGEDGDPLDVIVISEIPSFTGCAMECRIIGAIKAKQREHDGTTVRNDRYLAIPAVSVLYGHIHKMDELPKQILEELESFFINYNQQAGKKFKPLEWIQTGKALKAIKKAQHLSEPTKLIQLLLPLYRENGHPFPERYYTALKKKLAAEFGTVTAYIQAPAAGLWKDGKDDQSADQRIVYEVMAGEPDRPFWKKYKQQLQELFQQEDLVIRHTEIGLL